MAIAPAEPKNSSDDGIAARSVGLDDAASAAAAREDSSLGCTSSDLLGDNMITKRSAVATSLASQTKLGS